MIRIINKTNGRKNCKYDLFINNEHILTFEHDRRLGLGECLRQAYQAVIRKDMMDMVKKMESMKVIVK